MSGASPARSSPHRHANALAFERRLAAGSPQGLDRERRLFRLQNPSCSPSSAAEAALAAARGGPSTSAAGATGAGENSPGKVIKL